MNAYVKWVGVVQHKNDPNDIDVRIEPKFNTTVDVFVTHTIADGTKMVKIPVLYTVGL